MAQPTVQYAPKKCGFCKGKAVEFSRDKDYFHKCPVCKGTGSVFVAQPARRCPFCQGKAAYFWRDGSYYYKCKMCKGAGWSHVMK